jgi:hypothetical protein
LNDAYRAAEEARKRLFRLITAANAGGAIAVMGLIGASLGRGQGKAIPIQLFLVLVFFLLGLSGVIAAEFASLREHILWHRHFLLVGILPKAWQVGLRQRLPAGFTHKFLRKYMPEEGLPSRAKWWSVASEKIIIWSGLMFLAGLTLGLYELFRLAV